MSFALQELFEDWYFCQEQKAVRAQQNQGLSSAGSSNRHVQRHCHNQACMWAYWGQINQQTIVVVTCSLLLGPCLTLQDYFDWAKPLEESQPVQR